MIKNVPAMQKTQVQSLGREDPSGKGMAPHSSILAWRIPWTEEPGRLHGVSECQHFHLQGKKCLNFGNMYLLSTLRKLTFIKN